MLTFGLVSILVSSPAYSRVSPLLSPTRVTFTIPERSAASWTLTLWSEHKRLGTTTGTAGVLSVVIPSGTNCHLQADVRRNDTFYSAVEKTFSTCRPTSTRPVSVSSRSLASTGTGTGTLLIAGIGGFLVLLAISLLTLIDDPRRVIHRLVHAFRVRHSAQ